MAKIKVLEIIYLNTILRIITVILLSQQLYKGSRVASRIMRLLRSIHDTACQHQS